MFNRVNQGGMPWQGLVSGNQLQLANGSSKNWSMTIGNYGDTIYQKMPWAPGYSATPDQALEDLAAGRTWRDWFLLSGDSKGIYGRFSRAFGGAMGWVYAGPDGRPWFVAIYGINTSHTAFNGYVEARLFGGFGVAAETQSAPLVLADNGQPGSWPIATVDGIELPGGSNFRLMDVLPDGSKAIFCLTYQAESGQGSAAALGYIPAGFWLVELSGTPGVDFVADVSVLYTRSETIGTLSDTGLLPGRPALTYSAANAAAASPFINPFPGQMCTVTGQTINPFAEPTADARNGFTYSVPVGESERTLQVSGQVLACWFHPDTGQPTPVMATARMEWLDVVEEPTQSAGGTSSGERDGNSIPSHSGQINYSISYERLLRRHFSIALSYDGQSITDFLTDERKYTVFGSYVGEISLTLFGGEELRVGAHWEVVSNSGSGERTVTHPGGSTTEPTPYIDYEAYLIDWRYRDPINSTRQLYLVEPMRFFRDSLFVDDAPHELNVLRYSNNALSSVRRTGEPIDLATWRQGSCMTPAGIISGSITTNKTQRYGTWHPVTHALERGYNAPVCWI